MKRIIVMIIIVAALTGASIMSYKAFSGSEGASFISTDTPPEVVPSEILPMGASLNFKSVQEFNKESRLFPYPAVNATEVGPGIGELIQQ
jgi:hypothetical protein